MYVCVNVYIQGVPRGMCQNSGGCPYVKVYRYNPKHLCPELNGYGDNGQRKAGHLAVPNTATCTVDVSRDRANVLEAGMQC